MHNSKSIKNYISTITFDESIVLDKDVLWPKISIVTPSYNQGMYLEKTILSVLNQNYPNLEYIIIDGGSTDDSVDIIKKYAKYLSFWVSEPDKGQANAINKGFKQATGNIYAWLNSDDIYLPNAFIKIVNLFKKNPCYNIIYGNILLIDTIDSIIDIVKHTKFDLNRFIYKYCRIAQPSAFWKAEAFKDLNGLRDNLHFSMDTDLFMRMAKTGMQFGFLNDYLSCFRITNTQKTFLIKDVGLQERSMIIKELFNIEIRHNSFPHRMQDIIFQIKRFIQYTLQGNMWYAFWIVIRKIRYKDKPWRNKYFVLK